jgi:hypothetical protein
MAQASDCQECRHGRAMVGLPRHKVTRIVDGLYKGTAWHGSHVRWHGSREAAPLSVPGPATGSASPAAGRPRTYSGLASSLGSQWVRVALLRCSAWQQPGRQQSVRILSSAQSAAARKPGTTPRCPPSRTRAPPGAPFSHEKKKESSEAQGKELEIQGVTH